MGLGIWGKWVAMASGWRLRRKSSRQQKQAREVEDRGAAWRMERKGMGVGGRGVGGGGAAGAHA